MANEIKPDEPRPSEPASPAANQCQGCTNPATEPHTCPYAEEINGNDRLCTCCAECTHQCAMDI